MMDSENRRIARNSLYLYFRTFLILLISLYTVRVTLMVLGFVDYGVYNAIAGVISIFTFLSTTLTSVSQRYFSYYIGLHSPQKLNQCFNLVYLIFAGLTLLIIILLETIGLWYFYNKLFIPSERINAAVWVYHFSVLTLALNFLVIPYNSIIIAKEKMDYYAYVSIIEILLKLGVAFLLVQSACDSLKLYAILIAVVALSKYLIYHIYVSVNFKEYALKLFWDKSLFSELLDYIGWNTLGVFIAVVKNQGIILMVNLFFGPIVNSALAIGTQVYGAFTQFTASFIMAVQPQIVKKYAESEYDRMFDLVFLSSRFSYFLLLLLVIPFFFEMPMILKIWIGRFPEYTVPFSCIFLVIAIVESQVYPLTTAIQATGRVKWYNIITGIILIFILPVSYILLKGGYSATTVLYIALGFTIISHIARIVIVKRILYMSLRIYFKKIIFKEFIVTILATIIPMTISSSMSESLIRFVIMLLLSFVSTIIVIYLLGFENNERKQISVFLNKLFHRV